MHTVWCLGGLGNQMFQHAFYRSIELAGYEVYFDIEDFRAYSLHNGYELERVFDLKPKILPRDLAEKKRPNKIHSLMSRLGLPSYLYVQEYFGHQEPNLSKSKYWKGYWQSDKFFLNIQHVIRDDFKFKEHSSETINISDTIKKTPNSVSIHVRRGDYLSNELLGNICTENYYNSAINRVSKLIENPEYFVFSDDISWCKDKLRPKNATYVSQNCKENSYRDMQLMSECSHNIISNSSFSWWSAWLNDNERKIVVAPSKWFNDAKFYVGDIVPADWIKI